MGDTFDNVVTKSATNHSAGASESLVVIISRRDIVPIHQPAAISATPRSG